MTVGIIGLGLIGGSLAKAFHRDESVTVLGWDADHSIVEFAEIAQAIESAIPGILGKELRLNVSAAIPAVLLGVGFPVHALKGVPILARAASLIAHLNEEIADPIGFALSYQATAEQEYTGPLPAGWKAD